MSGFSSLAVQQAVVARLSADTNLMNGLKGVFDYVPQGTAYPYLVVHEVEAKDISNIKKQGTQITLEVHGVSDSLGRKSLLEKFERVHALLHAQPLVVAGQGSAVCSALTQAVSLRKDGLGFSGALKCMVTTFE